MKSGNVTVEPALKFVITKSSIESANASSAPARTPGAISGSVRAGTSAGRRAEVLRRLLERRSKPISRDRTVTTTNDRLNMMCAIRIVVNPVASREEEQRQQRRAEHDLRGRQREKDEEVDRRPAAELVAHERQRDDACRGSSRRSWRARRSRARHQRLAAPGDPERVLPVLERESLPHEVEAPTRVVEGEQDDDRDREEQIEQRERGVDVQRLSSSPPPRRRPPARRRSRLPRRRGGARRRPPLRRSRLRPDQRLVPAIRAQIITSTSMIAIRMNESAAAVG